MENENKRIAVVIPSLEPDDKFIENLKAIKNQKEVDLVIVDDGNIHIYDPRFKEAEDMGCIVLRHGVNCGKGRAIKTAFNHILVNMPEIDIIVTADGDGTYLAEDVIHVAMESKDNTITLGCRDFKHEIISKSMRDANRLTSLILSFLADITMHDTQTSLRSFHRDLLPYLITVNGERYEYDFNMIFEKKNIELAEVPISPTKRQSNKSSHFRPLKDTYAMMKTFLGFIAVSLSSTILDLVIYSLMIPLFIDSFPFFYITIATFIARVVSDVYNYYFDRTFVFKTQDTSSFGRYVILSVAKTILSAAAVTALVFVVKDGETWIKLFVDTVIFFMAYKIEKNWVHARK